MLFSIYDVDRSGAIDYKEFSSGVFGRPQTAGSSAKYGGAAQASSSDPEALALRLKEKLATRGARGIIGLQRQFKIMDDNNSKTLNKYEFTKAMNDFQLNFTQGEIAILFDYFDVDDNGECSYNEFLRAIRGPMNPSRKRITAQAFKKLDRDGNGWVDINDIRGVYNATHHPDVQQGKKTEEQVLQEFLETFETAHAMRENETPNYVVTKEEFEEYYNNISVGIDDDMYFQLMMENAWKLTEESRQGMGTKGWAGDNTSQPRAKRDNNIFGRAEETTGAKQGGWSGVAKKAAAGIPANASEAAILEHIQNKVKARGSRGISSLGRKFKIADDNRSGSLDQAEFAKAMHDFRMGLNKKQVQTAWDLFDRDGSGELSYNEFLRTIVGEMNPRRSAIAKKAFNIMDRDNSGKLDINDIRQTYNAKQHPDVQQGKKTEEEVLTEFLDTFEDHFADMKGHADSRDGIVTMTEWLEYYNNVSMSIDRDDYFELMMNNTWNLDGKRVTKKGWGGEF